MSGDGNRLNLKVSWRHTFSSPKFFIFDARILIFFVVAIMWLSWWTFFLAVFASFIVFVAEIKNKMSIGAFSRAIVVRIYDNIFIPLTGKRTIHGSGWRSNRPINKINNMTDRGSYYD